MADYPNGYSEQYPSGQYPERGPWPHYGDPRDGTYGEVPIIDGTNVRPDVLTDRAQLVALRAWVLQERDHALRITIGNGAASSLQFAIAMSDVAAVLWECITKLPPDERLKILERPSPRKRPRPMHRLTRTPLPPMISDDLPDVTDTAPTHY